MIIKKVYRNIHIDVNILKDTLTIQEENVIEDICMTFEDIKVLDKLEKFDSLIKQQQKYNKHLLINNPKPFDNLRILLKMLNNFLIVTKQSLNFSIEAITYLGDDELYVHGSEMYLGNISNITFSPSSRSHWTKPQIVNTIIQLG